MIRPQGLVCDIGAYESVGPTAVRLATLQAGAIVPWWTWLVAFVRGDGLAVGVWREWSGAEPRWRGRVEHVESGRQANILEIDDLLGFFQRFGFGDAGPPAGSRGGTGNRGQKMRSAVT